MQNPLIVTVEVEGRDREQCKLLAARVRFALTTHFNGQYTSEVQAPCLMAQKYERFEMAFADDKVDLTEPKWPGRQETMTYLLVDEKDNFHVCYTNQSWSQAQYLARKGELTAYVPADEHFRLKQYEDYRGELYLSMGMDKDHALSCMADAEQTAEACRGRVARLSDRLKECLSHLDALADKLENWTDNETSAGKERELIQQARELTTLIAKEVNP